MQPEVVARCDGGPLHNQEFALEGPVPAATIDVWDIMGTYSAVYLRSFQRFHPDDDTWRYIPSSVSYQVGVWGRPPRR